MLIARSECEIASCLSICSSESFVSEFDVGCLQWKKNRFCITFTRVHPLPLLCWEQFALTKFEVLTAVLLKNQFLCLHHPSQSTQRLLDPEDKSIKKKGEVPLQA
jgi:hypothetical protein